MKRGKMYTHNFHGKVNIKRFREYIEQSRRAAAMNKKQKKVLIRIIIAAVCMIVLHFLPVEGFVRAALYMIPYLVIGYDILIKAGKGIMNRQVFDENFLMAVATIEQLRSAITRKALPLCCFIRSASCSRAMQWARAAAISVI